jgi:putative Mg2+ transporter-C (MgtC) family protein
MPTSLPYPFAISPNLLGALTQWGFILLQLGIATVCGGLIGYQRELLFRPAGFRTHVLVCVGSAVYMLVSIAVAGDRFDPGRIAAQVASGIGFLGAGTIIKQGNIVRGLTTAASLWAVAGIGLAVGSGWPAMAIALLGTLVVFGALSLLHGVEVRFERGFGFTVTLEFSDPSVSLAQAQELFTAKHVELQAFAVRQRPEGGWEATAEGHAPSRAELDPVIAALTALPGVDGVRWDAR